ncbi:ChbG/HpnK family deacetylase [Clostridium sp. NSJ-145]|uniref:ChbG/HpnK family deacetylase n=1 Tax=Clostridium sp. NSJ-145 TaxID=2897777 RepID=UPI001E5A96A5|nr:ChbG/HpnK family deacetylase [Clostridium sp. NSJ-145]MCD2502900.1 ChbG/HpnK family deacetylase [Clostridium sp. NSJ-145]
MGKKYLIINADDFGVSKSVNKAIISLLEDNKISSTTLMPNVRYYKEAAEWAKHNKDKVGLHLTFVNDDSKYKYKSLSGGKSFEDNNGYLYEDVNKFRNNVKRKEIIKEVDLQIGKLKRDGVNITHIDLHRYSIYPTFNPIIYISLCSKLNKTGKLPIRWSKRGGYHICNEVNNLCDSDNVSSFFAAITNLFDLPMPDYVFKFPYRNVFKTYDEKKQAFINILNNLPYGISEIHIHPAIENDEIKELNPTWQERVFEYELMYDEDIGKLINDLGIELIAYSDISKISVRRKKFECIKDIISHGIKYVLKSLKRIV